MSSNENDQITTEQQPSKKEVSSVTDSSDHLTEYEVLIESFEDFFQEIIDTKLLNEANVELLHFWNDSDPLNSQNRRRCIDIQKNIAADNYQAFPAIISTKIYEPREATSVQYVLSAISNTFFESLNFKSDSEQSKSILAVLHYIHMSGMSLVLPDKVIKSLAISLENSISEKVVQNTFKAQSLLSEFLQMVCLRTTGLDSVFEKPRKGQLTIDTNVDTKSIEELKEELDLNKIFTKIIALSSPYRASLGESDIGKKNLEALISTLKALVPILVQLSTEPELHDLASFTVRCRY